MGIIRIHELGIPFLTRQYLYNGMIEGFEHCSSGHHNHIITIVLPHISEMMPDMSSRGQLDAMVVKIVPIRWGAKELVWGINSGNRREWF